GGLAAALARPENGQPLLQLRLLSRLPDRQVQANQLEKALAEPLDVIDVDRLTLALPGIFLQGTGEVQREMIDLLVFSYPGGMIGLTEFKETQAGDLPVEVVTHGFQPRFQQGRTKNIEIGAQVIDHFDRRLELLFGIVGAIRDRVREDLVESLAYEVMRYRRSS